MIELTDTASRAKENGKDKRTGQTQRTRLKVTKDRRERKGGEREDKVEKEKRWKDRTDR